MKTDDLAKRLFTETKAIDEFWTWETLPTARKKAYCRIAEQLLNPTLESQDSADPSIREYFRILH